MVIVDAAQAVLSTVWVPLSQDWKSKEYFIWTQKARTLIITFKKKKSYLLTVLSFPEHFKTTGTSFHSFNVSESCKQVSFVKLMAWPYTGVVPLKEMHIVVPCWPPSSSWCRGRWKNDQDVNQGQLQIKKQKIKTASAIYFMHSVK